MPVHAANAERRLPIFDDFELSVELGLVTTDGTSISLKIQGERDALATESSFKAR